MSAGNGNENKGNYSVKEIENSPFVVVGSDDRGYFVAMGNYRVSEEYPTQYDAEFAVERERWNLIAKVAGIIAERAIKEILNETKKPKAA